MLCLLSESTRPMRTTVKAYVRRGVARLLRDATNEITWELQRVQENSKALDYLGRLLRPLEPWTAWTMHPSAILTVVSDILINGRSMVVECGAGLSTLYIAKALSMQGGRLISFESDLAWEERIGRQIEEFGLGASVELVHAELSEWRFQERQYLWYTEKLVRENLESAPPVDLLVVDGPSRSVCRHARYPAVPVIRPYLNDKYAIILDDIHRREEREVVDLWRKEIDATFVNDYRARGVSYGRHGACYDV